MQDIISVLFFVILWVGIFKQKSVIDGFNLNAIITYYILVKVIDQLYTFKPAKDINDDIISGDLGNYLSKPVNYFNYMMNFGLGRRLARNTISLFIVLLAFIIFPNYLVLPSSIFNVVVFIIFAIFSWLLYYELAFFIGTLSFWFSETANIRSGIERMMGLLGGLWIPLAMFPQWIQNGLNLLPFKYLYSNLVLAYQGKLATVDIQNGLVVEAIWVISLFILCKMMWRKGIKKYETFGK